MKLLNRLKAGIQGMVVVAICLALPAASWADVINTASATYKDAASNPYTANSNTIDIVTPPVVTGGTLTLDVGVAMTPYQIQATNSPTSYSAGGLSGTGLTLNTATGIVSGTPTTAGVYPVTLSAANSAGNGPTATLTITVRGAATIVLTKSASASTAKSGDTVTFTIQYQNTGAGTASNVVLTDAIPTGSAFVTGSITGGGTLSANTISWTIPTVISGGSGNVSFQVKVN